jgi:Domain of unknown function (DUF4276)
MVKEIHIYVEGGIPKGRSTNKRTRYHDIQMRQGFNDFFFQAVKKQNVPLSNTPFKIILCGSNAETMKEFTDSLKNPSSSFNILLVDAEKEVEDEDVIKHLKSLNSGFKVGNFSERQCHLMVQCMEAWFIADHEGLKKCFAKDFKPSRELSKLGNVENLSKDKVFELLQKATNGKYNSDTKLQFSGVILKGLDGTKVAEKSKFCEKLLQVLVEEL